MAPIVHRKGFTVLHDGVRGDGDRPAVNIIFVHGLWGHPQRTWEAKADSVLASDTAVEGERRHSEPTAKTSSFSKIVRQVTFQKTQAGSSTARPAPARMTTTQSQDSASSLGLEMINSYTPSESSVVQSRGKKVYWPYDLLPTEFPDARIMTYGYDADVIGTLQGDNVKMNNFTTHSQNLMVALNAAITDDTPIIFVAHSLGGIIVKDALHRSKTNLNKDQKKMHRLTKCVVFLGTPHRGSKLASWSEICTKIVRLAMFDTRRKLLSSLRIDSEILETIQAEFVKMQYVGDFRIHSFQEGKDINGSIGKVVDDWSSRFDDHPMQIVEVIDASHRDMARFRSEKDPGFRQVTAALRNYISIIKHKGEEDDMERKSIASNFSSTQPNMKGGIFSVPHVRNRDFVGRVAVLQEIEKHLAQSDQRKSPFVAIYGLGGIGKSQVAVELAYRWKDSFPTTSIIWIHATNPRRLEKSYRDILAKLNIPESPDMNVKLLVENYLREKKNGRWLMIVDNVDDESVVLEKQDDDDDDDDASGNLRILSCIPQVPHGAVLFTSRYKSVAMQLTNELIELKEMSVEEGTALLKGSLNDDFSDSKDIKILLEELGYIPLAITHAAAFMRVNSMDIAKYLEIYKESDDDRIELLNHSFGKIWTGASGSDIPRPVLNTWSMSFNYVLSSSTAGPLASELLSVMSFMDRQEIPSWLLRNFKPKVSKYQFETACGTLKAISLISESSPGSFSMHRLVQLAMRRWLQGKGKDQEFAEKAINLLEDSFPDGSFKTWKECSALVVHAETVLSLSPESSNAATRARLLMNVATFQSNRGQYVPAEAKFAEVVKLKTELLGAANTETLRAVDSLALVMRHQAKYEAAQDLARKNLEIKEELSGAEHIDTLSTAHIVATLLGDRGKHTEAEKHNRQIWETRSRVLGANHPDTLASASNLSLSLWEQAKFEEAENLARSVLSVRETTLGDEHPLTLEIAGTLGFILETRGKLSEAEELKRNMLLIRERVLGPEHPDTADSLHDMGWILHQQGYYLDAEDYYDKALETKLKLLGEDHPKTLTTLCNFPVFYCEKGDYEQAVSASRRIIRNFQRIQGPEHPQTLDATGGLAVNLRHYGDLEGAEKAARTSIEGRNKVIGSDHPWTLPVVSHLGYIRTLRGEYSEGESIIRKALAGLEEKLGMDHPYVLISLLFLSKNLVHQGRNAGTNSMEAEMKLEEAETLARRALMARKKVLGEEHPYTWKTMYHLACVLEAREQYGEAEKMCRTALGGLQRSLGSEHPDVARCDGDHTRILGMVGKGVVDEGVAGLGREVVDQAVVIQLQA